MVYCILSDWQKEWQLQSKKDSFWEFTDCFHQGTGFILCQNFKMFLHLIWCGISFKNFLVFSRVKTQSEQVDHCLRNVRRYTDPLDQYIYLMDLLERKERLFYRQSGRWDQFQPNTSQLLIQISTNFTEKVLNFGQERWKLPLSLIFIYF